MRSKSLGLVKSLYASEVTNISACLKKKKKKKKRISLHSFIAGVLGRHCRLVLSGRQLGKVRPKWQQHKAVAVVTSCFLMFSLSSVFSYRNLLSWAFYYLWFGRS